MTLDSMHGVGIKELINLMSKIEDDTIKIGFVRRT